MKLFISFSLFFFSARYLAQANVVLLRRSEEELTEARQEVARSALLRAEVQRLQEEEEEKTESRERLGRRVSRELEELRAEHRVAG